MHAPPESVERRRDLSLPGPGHSGMDVAPADRGGQMALFGVGYGGHAAEVYHVHAAEVGHAVIHDEQLAVVAAVHDAQQRETPQRFPERVVGMDLHAGLPQVVKEAGRGAPASQRVVDQLDFHAGLGAFFERFAQGLSGGVNRVDVGLQPDPTARRANIRQHGLDERGRLREKPKFVARHGDARRRLPELRFRRQGSGCGHSCQLRSYFTTG